MRPSITRQEAIRGIAVARSAVSTPEALRTLLEDYQAKTVLEALEQAYGGVTNEFLALLHTEISGLAVDVVGEPDERHPCPCCKRGQPMVCRPSRSRALFAPRGRERGGAITSPPHPTSPSTRARTCSRTRTSTP